MKRELLTDAQDRARLAGLALVGGGLLLAIGFVWLQLALLRLPAVSELRAAPAVAKSAAGVAFHEVGR